MADKVKQFTIYRIKNLDRAEQEYYRTLQRTLDKIENDVVRLAGRDLPTQQGKLIELQAAVAIRPKIRTILQTEFLGWADTVNNNAVWDNAWDFTEHAIFNQSDLNLTYAVSPSDRATLRIGQVVFTGTGTVPTSDAERDGIEILIASHSGFGKIRLLQKRPLEEFHL